MINRKLNQISEGRRIEIIDPSLAIIQLLRETTPGWLRPEVSTIRRRVRPCCRRLRIDVSQPKEQTRAQDTVEQGQKAFRHHNSCQSHSVN